jgi:hypothetical protein
VRGDQAERFIVICSDCKLPFNGGGIFTKCDSCLVQIYHVNQHVNQKRKAIYGTPFINKKIKALRAAGLSLRAIGREVALSYFTVCRRLKKMED